MKELERKRTRAGRRAKRVRRKMMGTAPKPRLSVYRSNTGIFAQLIDDIEGRTLASASSRAGEARKSGAKGVDAAALVGKELAEKAREAGITKCVFDRGPYRYHGRVKAVAEAAREGGLRF